MEGLTGLSQEPTALLRNRRDSKKNKKKTEKERVRERMITGGHSFCPVYSTEPGWRLRAGGSRQVGE